MSPTLDAALLEGWADAAATALDRHRAEVDRINVFPVPDQDTGTNLLLTMRAATAAIGPRPAAVRASASSTAAALARGALRGARGNSGVILSQVLRGVAEAVAAADGPCAGATLTDALHRAARLAEAAVTRPREGTVLSVLAAAADAAKATGSDRLDEVAAAAAAAAGCALRATTAQLPELARAGVVDAGGLGLYLVLDVLAALISGRPPAPPADLASPASVETGHTACRDGGLALGPVVARPVETGHTACQDGGLALGPVVGRPVETGHTGCRDGGLALDAVAGPAYEVMYLLDGSDHARVTTLRTALDGLGDSVAVVGDGAAGGTGTWTVHVHCADVGAAFEAGAAAGRPHEVRVTPLTEHVFARARAVVAVLHAGPAADLARAAGADVLQPADAPPHHVDQDALASALAATGARHVTLLPCDPASTPAAERAALAARRTGQEVAVVPAASTVAVLAALAVHDPARHAGDDVVAMTEAAAGTRTGTMQVADAEALTCAGRCHPGDVLGIADGEVVVIAPDLAVGALWLASRMVDGGGELVTALLGAGISDALGEELAAGLRRTHPQVQVVVHRGARPGVPLELGVE